MSFLRRQESRINGIRMDDSKSILANPYFCKIVDSHREWLKQFNERHLKKWDDLFAKNNPEAALCEAATRQVLEEFDVDVEPYDDSSSEPTPDFKCCKDGIVFYVEVTCIPKEVATRKSGLEEDYEKDRVCEYAPLNIPISLKAQHKYYQSKNLEVPFLLVIGTFHTQVSENWFIKETASEMLKCAPIFFPVGKNQEMNKDNYKHFKDHSGGFVFIKINNNSLTNCDYKLKSISGILLCPFGIKEPKILGVLHPNPNYPFYRNLLPKVEFC